MNRVTKYTIGIISILLADKGYCQLVGSDACVFIPAGTGQGFQLQACPIDDASSLVASGLYGGLEVLGGQTISTATSIEPSEIMGSNKYKSTYGKRRITFSLQCIQYVSDSSGAYTSQPVPNCPLHVESMPNASGGSHDPANHPNNRPRGEIDLATANSATAIVGQQSEYDYQQVAGEINNMTGNPPSGSVSYDMNEDSAGDAVIFSWVAPEASGPVTLTAIGFYGQQTPATIVDNVTVEVQSLVAASGYTSPNGASWTMQSISPRHFNANGFATLSTLARLDNVVTAFGAGPAKVGQTVKIIAIPPVTITSISLPSGGMFDLNGKYTVASDPADGHVSHRRGQEIDIAVGGFTTNTALRLSTSLGAGGFTTVVPGENISVCPVGGYCPKGAHFHAAYNPDWSVPTTVASDD